MQSLRTTSLEYRGVVSTGRIGGGALTDRARVLAKPPCLAPMFGRSWTGPGLHRGETESLADPPHAPSPRQGGISVEHGSPIYCATTSQGVFQRAVSGTRYTLSDSQVSDPANLFFLAVPRTLGHTLCTWPRSCFWASCPGPPNLTQRPLQTPTQLTTLI